MYGYSCYWFEDWSKYDWQEQLEKRYSREEADEELIPDEEPDNQQNINE